MDPLVVVRFDWPAARNGGAASEPIAAVRAALVAAGADPATIAAYRSLPAAAVAATHATAAAAGDDAALGYAFAAGVADTDRLAGALAALPFGARASRLAPMLALAGAAGGEPAAWRYIVETDVEPAHEADFNAWYDTEHLAGLASVPGTARAARYRDLDAAPRYVACYDLARREAFNSEAWLAVRATAWSSRVRPSFRNTRRTMFRRED